ncbi:hypothetical protein NDU88_010305 [Pleurodeles waltl]|uniref:Uncharacterized protein n=1 Tax=Pleurodeles waltl TaxID=8319 RepID=A0AAV7Q1T6_PLEWA|nr:hypothetical protein NDU88_010305 [Pleurodeles waltl]
MFCSSARNSVLLQLTQFLSPCVLSGTVDTWNLADLNYIGTLQWHKSALMTGEIETGLLSLDILQYWGPHIVWPHAMSNCRNSQVDGCIENVEEQIGKSEEKDEQSLLRTNMEGRLDKYETEIQERKKNKFTQDEKDYKYGRILTFAKRFESLKFDIQRKDLKIVPSNEDTPSESDVSEGESSSERMDISSRNTFLEEMQVLYLDQRLMRGRGRNRN